MELRTNKQNSLIKHKQKANARALLPEKGKGSASLNLMDRNAQIQALKVAKSLMVARMQNLDLQL